MVTGSVLALPEIEEVSTTPSLSLNHSEVSASVGMLTVQSILGVNETLQEVSPAWMFSVATSGNTGVGSLVSLPLSSEQAESSRAELANRTDVQCKILIFIRHCV